MPDLKLARECCSSSDVENDVRKGLMVVFGGCGCLILCIGIAVTLPILAWKLL